MSDNPFITKGFLRKKRFCVTCGVQAEKDWTECPFCAPAQDAGGGGAPQKTQFMMVGPAMTGGGGGGTQQLLGWLVPLEGASKGTLYVLKTETTIGRDPTKCEILFADDTLISSEHAKIVAEDGHWVLVDNGSTNKTYVNGQVIDKHDLIDNDIIKMGMTVCKFKEL